MHKLKTSIFNGKLLPYVVILLAVFILYGHTLSFDITVFDDNVLVKNTLYEHFSNIFKFFSQDIFGSGSRFYRPVLSISLMSDYLLRIPGYFAFHFTNILLHAVACCLLFFFLIQNQTSRKMSFLLALLFAVHPAFVQAVAWIPGRNDTLLACICISSLIVFHKYLENDFSSLNSHGFLNSDKWLALHILLFLAAMFTKETAVMIPVATLSMAYADFVPYFDRKNAKKCLKFIIPQSLALILYFAVRISADLGSADIEYWESLKGLFLLPVFFLKSFFLFDFHIYKRWAYFSLPSLIVFCSLIAAGFFIADRKMRPKYILGIVFAFLFVAPVFVKTRGIYPFFLGHRFYLPSAFLLLSLSAILNGGKIRNLYRYISSGTLCCLYSMFFAFLIGLSYCQCSYFRDTNVFWEQACVEMSSDFTAQAMVAMNYYERDMIAPAVIHARKTLEINPRHEDMNMILGMDAVKKGDIGLALDYMRKELENNPKNATADMVVPQLENIVRKLSISSEQ